MIAQPAGFTRQRDENRLSDILRPSVVADNPECSSVDEIDVSPHQRRERLLRAGGGKLAEESGIVDHGTKLHPPVQKCHRPIGDDRALGLM